MTVSIVFITMIANCAYSVLAPFLPLDFERKGISNTMTGYIFAIYSVAVVIVSPFVGPLMQKLGRRAVVLIGMMLMGVAFILFGAISSITNKNVFIAAALSLRFLQGLASAIVQVTCYSVATNFYPDRKNTVIGILEASQGLGKVMGPLLGTAFYSIAGYDFMLYAFGSLFMLISFFIPCLMPKSIDKVIKQGANLQDSLNVSGHFAYQRRISNHDETFNTSMQHTR